MTILDEIIEHKKMEVTENKSLYPVKLLEKSIYFANSTVSLKEYLLRNDKSGIIAEFKRRSPSKGNINISASVEQVTIGYMMAGASALSILTDQKFFGGSNADLTIGRKFNFCPVLRKDFVVDEYQIIEAKSIGADAILLIAAALSIQDCNRLAKFAKSLGLEVLLEVHSKKELDWLSSDIDVLGVNNRNLHTFKVDIQLSIDLIKHMPRDVVKISESGLSQPTTVIQLKQAGYNGFLMGEHFMRSPHPEETCRKFISRLNLLQHAD